MNSVEELQQQLKQANETIARLTAIIDRLTADPNDGEDEPASGYLNQRT